MAGVRFVAGIAGGRLISGLAPGSALARTAVGIGYGALGYQAYQIGTNWNQLSTMEKVGTLGIIAGGIVGGWAGYARTVSRVAPTQTAPEQIAAISKQASESAKPLSYNSVRGVAQVACNLWGPQAEEATPRTAHSIQLIGTPTDSRRVAPVAAWGDRGGGAGGGFRCLWFITVCLLCPGGVAPNVVDTSLDHTGLRRIGPEKFTQIIRTE